MLFDSHAHPHFNAFTGDTDDVMRRAREHGVEVLIVGTQRATSRQAVALADRYDGAWAAVGLHPIHLEAGYYDPNEEPSEPSAGRPFRRRAEAYDPEAYRALARSSPKVVAIGETGLDYYRLDGAEASREAAKERQREAFRAQAELAAELDLALVVHCREAHGDVCGILKDVRETNPHLRGVIHCFTGTSAEAEQHLALGFSLSFPGIITFARDWDDLIRRLPLDRLLVETDCPYLTPVPYRGQRNEPAYVEYTARHLARLKGLAFEAVAAATTANARRLFRLPAP